MTEHCTACREQNGNKIYYRNLRKVWKERSVINLYWKILKCFKGTIFPRLSLKSVSLITGSKSIKSRTIDFDKFIRQSTSSFQICWSPKAYAVSLTIEEDPWETEKFLRRREFRTTETELSAIAVAASIGCKAGPPKGTSKPAATGMPITL